MGPQVFQQLPKAASDQLFCLHDSQPPCWWSTGTSLMCTTCDMDEWNQPAGVFFFANNHILL